MHAYGRTQSPPVLLSNRKPTLHGRGYGEALSQGWVGGGSGSFRLVRSPQMSNICMTNITIYLPRKRAGSGSRKWSMGQAWSELVLFYRWRSLFGDDEEMKENQGKPRGANTGRWGGNKSCIKSNFPRGRIKSLHWATARVGHSSAPPRLGPARLGSARPGSARLGPAQLGSARLWH